MCIMVIKHHDKGFYKGLQEEQFLDVIKVKVFTKFSIWLESGEVIKNSVLSSLILSLFPILQDEYQICLTFYMW